MKYWVSVDDTGLITSRIICSDDIGHIKVSEEVYQNHESYLFRDGRFLVKPEMPCYLDEMCIKNIPENSIVQVGENPPFSCNDGFVQFHLQPGTGFCVKILNKMFLTKEFVVAA